MGESLVVSTNQTYPSLDCTSQWSHAETFQTKGPASSRGYEGCRVDMRRYSWEKEIEQTARGCRGDSLTSVFCSTLNWLDILSGFCSGGPCVSCCLKLISFRTGEEYCGFAPLLWGLNHTKSLLVFSLLPGQSFVIRQRTVAAVVSILNSCAAKIVCQSVCGCVSERHLFVLIVYSFQFFFSVLQNTYVCISVCTVYLCIWSEINRFCFLLISPLFSYRNYLLSLPSAST